MRILRFDLLAYGGFTDRSLDLGAEGATFHVIYGPNEAGKSTALRALEGLLFGIPHRTTDAYLHKTGDLRVGALLEGEGGARLEVVRRKGNRSTLLGPDGKALADDALVPFLAGVSAEGFARGFGLDHRSLREGGEALLRNEGAVGESLFDAGRFGLGVARLSKELEEEARRIFAPRGSTLPLNQAIEGFKAAKARIKAEALAADTFLAQEAEVRELEARLAQLDEDQRELRKARRRLEALCRTVPLVAEWRELEGQRARLGEGPFVSAEVTEARKAVAARAAERRRDLERIEAEIAAAEGERLGISITESLLAIPEPTLDRLAERLAHHRKAALDRPKRIAELRALEGRLDDLARELGHPTRHEVEARRPRADQVARLRALTSSRSGLEASARSAKAELGRIDARLEALGARLAAAPATVDVAVLAPAVEAARRAGDLTGRLEEARGRVEACGRELDDALRAVAPFRGGRAALEAFARPLPETLDRHAAAHEALVRARARLDEEGRALDTREVELVHRDEALAVHGELPAEGDLAKARADRDALWSEVRASGDVHGPSGERLGPAIAAADAVADRLRAESKRVAERAALKVERHDLERRRARWVAAMRELEAKTTEARAAYVDEFAPLGFEPPEPSELRGLLARLEDASRALAALRQAEMASEALASEAARHAESLASALTGLGQPTSGPLAALLGRAEHVLVEAKAAEAARAKLVEERERLAEERAVALAERVARDAELEAHRAAWGEAVSAIGLPPSSTHEEASAVLDRLGAFFPDLDKARDLERRVAAMEADARALDHDALELARAHAPELEGACVEDRVALLVKRSREARQAALARDAIDRQLARHALALDTARAELETAEAELDAFRRAAGAGDLDALQAIEVRSAHARALDDRLAELAVAIAREGEGKPIATLVDETAGVALDAAKEELDAVEARLEDVQRGKEDTKEKLGVAKSALEGARDRSAEDAAAEAESHLAKAKVDARSYLRLRVAAAVLRREIERYRERNQGPVLARARALFPRLTLGRYADLVTDFDDKDHETLVCVRPDGGKVPVPALSDGTRDQLHLALRLATLERQSPPLPLVLDDVLIHFDDARARAALAVLGEVSAVAQILLFTHHARIAELACEVVAPPALAVHSLAGVADLAPRASRSPERASSELELEVQEP